MTLTSMSATPMMARPTSEARHLPILCPSGPNRFVPIR